MTISFDFVLSRQLERNDGLLDAVAKFGVLLSSWTSDAAINPRDVFQRKRFGFRLLL